ncbi:two-component sensor histidine kinase [Acrocarpospora phusangensis]|uniref:Two-component sensor histidine kinase n=1 Tax=Acrocarpospora phusangensis TaxID=1070424 RepID=A0A919Q9Y8_9ACTN|nr:two-component sensor histidine kinase [Acrocarpospora phusangensis]
MWVVLTGFPAAETVSGGNQPAWLSWAALAAAAVLYLWAVRLAFADRGRAVRLALPALITVAVAGGVAFQGAWSFVLTMAAIATGTAVRGALGMILLLALAAVGVFTQAGLGPLAMIFSGWGVFVAGLIPWIIVQLWDTIHELTETRRELARVAVSEERLRFSRDLHDLLGHTLSVIVVKAEAVRRLIPGDGETAARQAADIEQIGRLALAEVRAAVTGYRGRGLEAELAAARDVLADAGIGVLVQAPSVPLPPETDALLGWAVREGVTNVVRHSAARSCRITLRQAGELELEIVDDGKGAREPVEGNGLGGLRERVEAAGGRLAVAGEDGFRLRVTVPA